MCRDSLRFWDERDPHFQWSVVNADAHVFSGIKETNEIQVLVAVGIPQKKVHGVGVRLVDCVEEGGNGESGWCANLCEDLVVLR